MVARHSGVVDAFEHAASSIKESAVADASEAEAVETAAEMERKGLAFYRDRAGKASCEAEARFYRSLVAEEEVHLATLKKVRSELS